MDCKVDRGKQDTGSERCRRRDVHRCWSDQAAQDLGGAPAQPSRLDIERAGAFLLALALAELGAAVTAGAWQKRKRSDSDSTALIGCELDHVVRCRYAFLNHCCLLAQARGAPSTFDGQPRNAKPGIVVGPRVCLSQRSLFQTFSPLLKFYLRNWGDFVAALRRK